MSDREPREFIEGDPYRRDLFLRLTQQIAEEREALGVTEQEVLDDFAEARRRARADRPKGEG